MKHKSCLLAVFLSLMIFGCDDSSSGTQSSEATSWTKEEGVRVAEGVSSSTIILSDGTYRMYYQGMGEVKSATSSDGVNFTVEDGARLETGAAGSYDSEFAGNPAVIQLSDGRYRMYYSGRDGTQSTSRSGQEQDTIRILSAISEDGLNFTKEDGIRIDSTVAENGVNDYGIADVPDVIIDSDGEYLMYYVYDWYGDNSIHAARSSDGLAWTRFAMTDLGNDVVDPDVVQLSDGRYRLYFASVPTIGDRESGPMVIHSAISACGITWVYEGIVIQVTESWERTWVGDPDLVELSGGGYRMYYYGMDDDDNSDIVSAVYQ